MATKRWLATAALAVAGLSLCLFATPPARRLASLPYRVRLTPGEERELAGRLPLPLYVRAGDGAEGLRINGRPLPAGRWWRAGSDGLAVAAARAGRYRLDVRAFGLVPVRRVTVEVLPPLAVAVGGQSIGVIVTPGGVLVVADEEVRDAAGRRFQPAREAGVRPGDLIVAADGRPVRTKDDVAAAVERAAARGAPLALTVRRGEREFPVAVTPVRDAAAGRPLIGLWVRDGATGIGTLSFYDPATGRFGALGHQIVDAGGRPFRFASGTVVEALISGVRPGRPGDPGEKLGVFLEGARRLGVIERNTTLGIFGRLEQLPGGGPAAVLPVALEGEVHPGPARLLTVIRGQEPEAFDVTIERVWPRGRPSDKGLIVRVNDPRLLATAGGIVQGMSGSPLVQDGKLAGVVTHVFVNDPTRGYGVLAEWMVRGLQDETLLARRPLAWPAPARAASR